MKIEQITIKADAGAFEIGEAVRPLQALAPNWLLVFGSVAFFENPASVAAVTRQFPGAVILGCSTAGEISTRAGAPMPGVEAQPITLDATHASTSRSEARIMRES